MAPLASVILGSLLVYLTHAEKHGVQVVSVTTNLLSMYSCCDIINIIYNTLLHLFNIIIKVKYYETVNFYIFQKNIKKLSIKLLCL